MVLRLKEATSTIPIVGNMGDPIAWGIVDSLARPGGNITGICDVEGEEIMGKRLGLLRELMPGAARVGYLASRDVAKSIRGVDMRKTVHRQAYPSSVRLSRQSRQQSIDACSSS
jgi:putative ABC transport system substrate-binding protein